MKRGTCTWWQFLSLTFYSVRTFCMTPSLKLINAIRCYKWNATQNSVLFSLFFAACFHIFLEKNLLQSPPFQCTASHQIRWYKVCPLWCFYWRSVPCDVFTKKIKASTECMLVLLILHVKVMWMQYWHASILYQCVLHFECIHMKLFFKVSYVLQCCNISHCIVC